MANASPLVQALPPGFFTGVPTTGISPTLLAALVSAVKAAGGTGIDVTSGRRPPGPGNDVKDSNHITGDALDGYAIVNGQQVPIGQAILPVAARFGLRSGDVAGFDPKTAGGFDPVHVDDGANVGRTQPFSAGAQPAPAAPTTSTQPDPSWPASATLAYNAALKAGLNPTQAKDFAANQFGESGFNPKAVNKSSGAAGLYQLLSPGYVSKANALGGVLDPEANIQAILPDYKTYYQSHPFQPGAAGAAVERSGEGADYYAQGWQHLPGMPGTKGSPMVTALSSGPAGAVGSISPKPLGGPAPTASPILAALRLLGVNPGGLK